MKTTEQITDESRESRRRRSKAFRTKRSPQSRRACLSTKPLMDFQICHLLNLHRSNVLANRAVQGARLTDKMRAEMRRAFSPTAPASR